MSVDPGDGYRLLIRGEIQQDGDEFFYDRDKKWHPVYCVGHVLRSKEMIRRRIEPIDNTGVEVTTSGPYVAIEVHRAALAEIERLKAELDAVKNPQSSPEPEWFDLTPFGEHVWRSCDEAFLPSRGQWLSVYMANAVGASISEMRRVGYTQFRCRLKDTPPELVAMANRPAEDPDEWVTQDWVPARPGIDRYQWVSQGQFPDADNWSTVKRETTLRHGDKDNANLIFQLRCCRRDLPPLQEKPKTETEREVLLYWYDGNIVGRYADCPPTDPSFVPLILRAGKVFIETETREVVR